MPPVPDIAWTKADWRARFRAYRDGLTEAAYARHSAAIVAHLRALPEVRQARTIHVYWPMTARREIDLRPLILELQAAQKQILLPVVVNFDPPTTPASFLQQVRFTGEAHLRQTRWGLYEPISGETVPPEALDLVIAPALGADRHGYRLGYGQGHYDRFLQGLSVPVACPVYAACLVAALPHEAHDHPVTLVVTEAGPCRIPPA